MALTNAFYNAVNSGDVLGVRIMMKDSLLLDLTFNDFHEMEKAASSMEGLYDAHDGKPFVEDSSQWDDDYMDKVMVNIVYNFSHERIAHLQKVVRYLRPVPQKIPRKVQQRNPRPENDNAPKGSYQEEKRRVQENGDYLGAKIGAGAVLGAAAGGIIASAAGATAAGVVGGIAIGTAVGGAVAVVITNGGK